MNLFDWFFYFLTRTFVMETPKPFGWFHLLFLTIIISTTIFICIKFKNCDEKTFRKILFIGWITIICLEFIKQFLFAFQLDESTMTASYSIALYAFPFQFCSSPFYILPFIIFMKDCKFRDWCIAFIGLFSLFAGISVMIYVGDIVTNFIFINIQTMVHHGSQIVLGVFCLTHVRKKIDLFYFKYAVIIFSGMATCAIILDEIVPLFTSDTFNMWFISRHFTSSLPILCDLQPKVPYIVFLLIYLLGFTLVAFIVNAIAYFVIRLSNKKNKAVST